MKWKRPNNNECCRYVIVATIREPTAQEPIKRDMAHQQTHNTAGNASNLQDQFLTARYCNKGQSCGEQGVPSHPSCILVQIVSVCKAMWCFLNTDVKQMHAKLSLIFKHVESMFAVTVLTQFYYCCIIN